jgi:hypothetical protein
MRAAVVFGDVNMNIAFEHATIADAEALVAVQIAAFHHDAVLYPGVENCS